MIARLLALLLLPVAGCTVLRSEISQPIAWNASRFVEGETHYGKVLGELGPPLRLSRYGNGVAFLYEYLLVKEGQIGISYDGEEFGAAWKWLELVKFSFGNANANRQTLIMIFDRKGTLRSERFLTWDQKLGSGFSFQFLVEAGSIVDTTAVRSEVEAYDWGAMMLRPLPQTLNAVQSIDDGRFGLEQRGTPNRAGQRALEMRPSESESFLPFLTGD